MKKFSGLFFTGICILLLFVLSACPKNEENSSGTLIESIAINEGGFSLVKGQDKQLSVTITPENASKKDINWTSSNTDAATVSDSGLVTAFAEGETTITAEAQDGSGVSGSVIIIVTAALMSPQEIFESLKGQKVTTNGWADMYNGGDGLYYTNPANLTLIDDATYPDAPAKRQAFTNAINNDTVKFIIVSGDIDLSDGKISDTDKSYFNEFSPTAPYGRLHGDISHNLASNTVIIGINDARLMFGGLTVRNGAQNIIIRNVTFYDAHGSTANDTSQSGYIPGTSNLYADSKASATGLQIENKHATYGICSGIWVDHCKFTDGTCVDLVRNYNHDGAFDIKAGKFITVSWNEFTNHDKVMLVGSNDNLTGTITYLDPEERQITLHHNYFHGCTQRMPRTRGSNMHVYNNYYRSIGTNGNSGYCLGPGLNAKFIVESNYFATSSFFHSTNTKIHDEGKYDSAEYPAIVWAAENNATVIPSRHDPDSGAVKPWEPAYSYELDNNDILPTSIPADAGPVLVFRK